MSEILNISGPEREPKSGSNPKQLVIFLHGLGADGSDLISLSPYFADFLPNAKFVSPHAPFDCDMAPIGLQWFSLQDRSEESILKGVKKAEPILNKFIDEQIDKYNLKSSNVALVGFSQGSMLAMYGALRRKESLGAVLAYSGALVAPQLLEAEKKSSPALCLVHGEADEIVPFVAFEEALANFKKYNIEVEAYSRGGLGHGIDPAGIQIGQQFLKKNLL